MTKNSVLGALSLCIGLALSSSASADTVVTDWNDQTLEAIRVTHPGPPMVARMLAVTNTAMFDAWAAYDKKAVGTRLGGTLRRPEFEHTKANKEKAMSYAAYRALVDLFPSMKPSFDAEMAARGYDINDTSTNLSTPQGIGNVAAQAVIDFRHNDGSNQLGNLNGGLPYSDYTGYVPQNTWDTLNNPNAWQPLRFSDGAGGFRVQKFIAPHWGAVTPFALTSPDQFTAKSPAMYPNKAYTKQALEVILYSAFLTDRQKVIAEYWADGPSSELPPGHWALFAKTVSNRDHHGINKDMKMFFSLTNAVLDASVITWEAKRSYDYIRPVSAIRFLFKGKKIPSWAGEGLGTRFINGEDWRPYQASTVVTPPFSEYYSGHSTFSASGAEVLKLFTGSDYFGHSVTIAAGSSAVEPGLVPHAPVTLSWPTFSAAADEAGISRRYGGIHFIDGDLAGREIGRKVGKQAYEKAKKYINGTIDD
jgi:hypothetical protein